MSRRRLSRLLALAAVVGWLLLLRPTSLGGPAGYQIVSGTSMEPLLHSGDLVITQAQPSYGAGDVVVFRVPRGQVAAGAMIVHRIIGRDGASGFVTKGDNRATPDLWHPMPSDVIGRSWIRLPAAGDLLTILRRPLVLAALMGGVIGLLVMASGSKPQGATRHGPRWRSRLGLTPDPRATDER